MHSAIVLLASIGAAMAASNDICGPDSNCEFVDVSGRKTIRFRENMGPGSDDYVTRFGNKEEQMRRLRARKGDDIKTKVTIGENEIPWGCRSDIVVEDWIREGLDELCKDNGCDEGSDKKFDSEYVVVESLDEADLIITAEGIYPDGFKDNFIDAMAAIPPSGAVTWKEKDYVIWGAVASPTTCDSPRFANYVQVSKFEGDTNLVGHMEFKAELSIKDESGQTQYNTHIDLFLAICEMINKILGSVAGAVSGIGGGFFGLVEVMCG
ncbi:hypothetical protein ACO1O0_008826 [Amphichorda felina]